MGKNFIIDFKNDFKFLEEYGFVFAIDPCNPNRPCYKNNHGEIIFWIDYSAGVGAYTEIYYQINGWKYSLNLEEEYKKIFKKSVLFKSKIKMFKDLFEYLVLSTGSFYNLKIEQNINDSLKNEEVTDLNVFKSNKSLFNHRNRAITNQGGIYILLILFLLDFFVFLIFEQHSKSYQVMNIVYIFILISILISQLLIFWLLRRSLHILSSIFLISYAFIPITLYFFFDHRFDYKVEIIFFGLTLCSAIIHLFIYLIKKHSYYMLNGFIPLICPLFVSFVKTFILDDYLFLNELKIGMFLVIGIFIGIFAAGVTIIISKKKNSVKETFGLFIGMLCLTWMITSMVPFFTIQNINYAFDKSTPIKQEFVIVNKEVGRSSGRYSSNIYYLVVEINNNEESLQVNKRVYSDFEINEIIDLYLFEGCLDKTYYEYVEENL